MCWLDTEEMHMCLLQEASWNKSIGFIGYIALNLDKFSEIFQLLNCQLILSYFHSLSDIILLIINLIISFYR